MGYLFEVQLLRLESYHWVTLHRTPFPLQITGCVLQMCMVSVDDFVYEQPMGYLLVQFLR